MANFTRQQLSAPVQGPQLQMITLPRKGGGKRGIGKKVTKNVKKGDKMVTKKWPKQKKSDLSPFVSPLLRHSEMKKEDLMQHLYYASVVVLLSPTAEKALEKSFHVASRAPKDEGRSYPLSPFHVSKCFGAEKKGREGVNREKLTVKKIRSITRCFFHRLRPL